MDTKTKQHLLVVDDDEGIRELLSRYLIEQGFEVQTAADAVEMDARLENMLPDLMILDLMMPGEDGLSVAKRVRNQLKLPIIMLSARGDDIDRIVGLEVGADDYMPKPFNPRELLARVRAVLRRGDSSGETAENDDGTKDHEFAFGPFVLDTQRRTLRRDSQSIEVTTGEFNLLLALVEHPNRALSRDQLVDLIKGYDRSPYDRSIDVRVTRLRHKLETNPKKPAYIRTVWGVGYMFTPEGTQP